MPSPALPWFELARFRRSRLTRAAVIAVTIVPLLYGALYVWANLDPTRNLDRVQAAVVNEDQLVEVTGRDGEKQPVAVGRLLAGNLVSDDSRDNYDWVLTDARDASRGLSDGTYKAVLTIPSNLSKAATSTDGDPEKAVQGELDLVTDDAVSYVNGAIAERILSAARSALNAQVTETYLDNVYLSFSDVKKSLAEAADGADDLSDGADRLSGGASDLADGNRQLTDGASQLANGTGQLADGLTTLDRRTDSLPGDTRRLADGARQVSDGAAELDRQVGAAAAAIRAGSGDAEATIGRLSAALDQAADQCEAAGADGVDCGPLRQAANDAGSLGQSVAGIGDRADQLNAGTRRLASGADQVADGADRLADAAPALSNGIGQAAQGARQVDAGARQLENGAQQAATGADALASGAATLSGGAARLAAGLRDGTAQVPDYDKNERDQLAKTVATPVDEAVERANGVQSNGEALAPYFMALALWVGAMAIYLLLRPLSARALASTAGSVRTAFAGLVPGLAISAVQALLLVAVLEGVVGIRPADQLLTLGAALAAGGVFTCFNQMFVALFGGAGRFVALVFVCLQLTAAGGTYPIETSPAFFGFLHDLLPMTYVVNALRAGIAGGGAGVGSDFTALAVFAALAIAVTIVAAHRRRTVTVQRLHPALVV